MTMGLNKVSKFIVLVLIYAYAVTPIHGEPLTKSSPNIILAQSSGNEGVPAEPLDFSAYGTRYNAKDFSYEDLLRKYPDSAVYFETLRAAGTSAKEAAKMFEAYLARIQNAIGPREFVFNSLKMNPQGVRMLSNYEWLTKFIDNSLKTDDLSNARWIASAFDNVLQLPLLLTRDILRYDETKSEEYVYSLSMPFQEFRSYWFKEVTSAKFEGIFNIREYENLKEIQALVENFGTDSAATIKQFTGCGIFALLWSYIIAISFMNNPRKHTFKNVFMVQLYGFVPYSIVMSFQTNDFTNLIFLFSWTVWFPLVLLLAWVSLKIYRMILPIIKKIIDAHQNLPE